MDGYQFAAALVQSLVSLAWPAVVGLIAWGYKESILTVIQRMNGTIKGFGLEFSLAAAGQTAKVVEQEVASEQALSPAVTSNVPPSSADTARLAESKEEEPPEPLSAQPVSWTLEEVAEFVPVQVFSESMSRIKDQLLDIYNDSGVPLVGPATPRNMARQLASAGFIDWTTAKLVAQLADIANKSRHAEPTSQQANQFLSMAESVQKSLNGTRVKLKLRKITKATLRSPQ